jgi:hypothetical protein
MKEGTLQMMMRHHQKRLGKNANLAAKKEEEH